MTHKRAILYGTAVLLVAGYLMIRPRDIPQIQKRGECRLPRSGEVIASNTYYVADGMYIQNCWATRKVKG